MPTFDRPVNLAKLSPERLAALLDGDRRERRRLAKALVAHLDRALYFALRSQPLVLARKDDLLSELLLYLYRDDARVLRRWDPDRAGLKGYLGMIATRYARRTLNERPIVTLLPDDEDDGLGPPSRSDANLEIELTYRAALARLAEHLERHGSDKDRRRFLALFVQERPTTEVAQAEGASLQALHTWACRLKKRLHRAFPGIAELLRARRAGRAEREPASKDE